MPEPKLFHPGNNGLPIKAGQLIACLACRQPFLRSLKEIVIGDIVRAEDYEALPGHKQPVSGERAWHCGCL